MFILKLKRVNFFGSLLIHIIFFFPDLFIVFTLENKNEIEVLEPYYKTTFRI